MKFKFSIRDLLFVILLAAVSAAWITDINKIAEEREAIQRKEIELDNQIDGVIRENKRLSARNRTCEQTEQLRIWGVAIRSLQRYA